MVIKLWQAIALTAVAGLAVGFLLGHAGSANTVTVAGPTVTNTLTVDHVKYKVRVVHKPAAPVQKRPATHTPAPSALSDKDFTLQSLTVKDDGLGDIGGVIRVTNNASIQHTAEFEITFFQNGNVVGTAVGSGDSVAPGQTVTADLVSQDPLPSGAFRYTFQVSAEF